MRCSRRDDPLGAPICTTRSMSPPGRCPDRGSRCRPARAIRPAPSPLRPCAAPRWTGLPWWDADGEVIGIFPPTGHWKMKLLPESGVLVKTSVVRFGFDCLIELAARPSARACPPPRGNALLLAEAGFRLRALPLARPAPDRRRGISPVPSTACGAKPFLEIAGGRRAVAGQRNPLRLRGDCVQPGKAQCQTDRRACRWQRRESRRSRSASVPRTARRFSG